LCRSPAKARELEAAARKLGFAKVRQTGSHAIWAHQDGRATTIPVHGNRDISTGVYFSILKQLGITEEQFRDLR
jgi:predicted RNA binding protein YcfA (HicA-like mRNA interferase family)